MRRPFRNEHAFFSRGMGSLINPPRQLLRERCPQLRHAVAPTHSADLALLFPFPTRVICELARCLVLDFDGASLSHDSKEALWDKFYTAAPPRRRQSVEQYKIVKRA